MTDYLIKALLMVKAAQPASGFRPETPQEWRNAQKASEEMGYAMFRQAGWDDKSARKLANEIYGGAAGRLLLEVAFSEGRHD
jgi:hypothetical protein